MSEDLLRRLDGLRVRLEALLPLFPSRASRVSAALDVLEESLLERVPQTADSLVRRLAAREGDSLPFPDVSPARPLTPREEGALQGIRGVAERIAELHRLRSVRRYEMAVEYHPPRREVWLKVHPGPTLPAVRRGAALILRLSGEGEGYRLEARDDGGSLWRSLEIPSLARSWHPPVVEAFIVEAVDEFLAGVVGIAA